MEDLEEVVYYTTNCHTYTEPTIQVHSPNFDLTRASGFDLHFAGARHHCRRRRAVFSSGGDEGAGAALVDGLPRLQGLLRRRLAVRLTRPQLVALLLLQVQGRARPAARCGFCIISISRT